MVIVIICGTEAACGGCGTGGNVGSGCGSGCGSGVCGSSGCGSGCGGLCYYSTHRACIAPENRTCQEKLRGCTYSPSALARMHVDARGFVESTHTGREAGKLSTARAFGDEWEDGRPLKSSYPMPTAVPSVCDVMAWVVVGMQG